MTHGFVVAMLGALASVSAHAASINSIYDMDRTVTFSGTYTGFLIHVARAMAP